MTVDEHPSPEPDATLEAHGAVMQMVSGFWVSQIVRTAADFSLAEHLRDGPRTAEEIASRESADVSATFRLMRACVSVGLLAFEGEGFAGTPLLAVLHRDSPMSVKSFALAQTAPGHWLTWGRTSDAIRQGRSQSTEALGKSIFDYFAEHPQEGALFSAAMTDLSTPVILEAVKELDVTGAKTVVDVGGANGAFVLELLAAHPHLEGVVLELPHAVPGAEAEAKNRGLEDRLEGVAGDFFELVPEGDLYLLKYILHDWDDESCVRILRLCRQAMRPGARVTVVDMVIAEQDGGFAPLMDIAMLTMLSSRERTAAEFDSLFEQAGLRRVRTTELQAPYSMIEAVAV
ncbi:methyltransferase [Actinoallomurus bryophytorum]|uniref:Methyltransferase family protein n=1 Tax=Actinoallomurus bryophytorum TaxID=1490222 RepID=A0A543CUD9_9ACTN|nr:methyltransferase [Actinoallomurus bryophytorum]TQM00659.1 methyltransferase family protein [Actinoallomurus bryophytorum]